MCIFCDEIETPEMAQKIFGPVFKHKHRILYADHTIVAIPGYGPQVYPYVLALTRRHAFSFLNVTKEERNSFFDFFELLLNTEFYSGSELCIFEHGGEPKNGCSSITHCHIHIIDANLNFYDFIDWGIEQQNITITSESGPLPYEDYLFIGKYCNGTLEAKINTTAKNEHQYFRKKLSELINIPDWDWNLGMNNNTFVPKMIDEAAYKLKNHSYTA